MFNSNFYPKKKKKSVEFGSTSNHRVKSADCSISNVLYENRSFSLTFIKNFNLLRKRWFKSVYDESNLFSSTCSPTHIAINFSGKKEGHLANFNCLQMMSPIHLCSFLLKMFVLFLLLLLERREYYKEGFFYSSLLSILWVKDVWSRSETFCV